MQELVCSCLYPGFRDFDGPRDGEAQQGDRLRGDMPLVCRSDLLKYPWVMKTQFSFDIFNGEEVG